ncbi:piggyBac transposable element-derived protein 4-like [Schistocerca americana]|uniref:piggyBac transposable element-derived protein 4-like n=1 Tax=Schistocerca americana TaxID=7009 RepID=UPI001F4F7E3F|nr:piggyBac transposable element-derived protein 4-like [Schistocerca americana]
MCNTEVYTGGKGNDDDSVKSLVLRLCSSYLGKEHMVYMDRFYTSPAVLEELWERNTLGVGTVMKNRIGLPRDLINQKLKKGEMTFRCKGHLFYLKWKKKRDVHLLSTQHNMTALLISVKSRSGYVEVVKPDIVLDYNLFQTGVDIGDQLISYYPFQ